MSLENLNHVAYQTVLGNMHGNTGLIESATNYIINQSNLTDIPEVSENNIWFRVLISPQKIKVDLYIGLGSDDMESVDRETLDLIKDNIRQIIEERDISEKETKFTEGFYPH